MNDRSRTSLTILRELRDPENRDAWRRFVDRYGPRIVTWCRRWKLQEADVEDLTQDLLLKIRQKMPSFQYDPTNGKTFHGWLKRVVHNALSSFVTRRREGALSFDPLDPADPGAELTAALDAEFERERLEVALGRVRERVGEATWEAFRLTALEGLAGKEVAARLGIQVAHVYVYKGRVQALLKAEIERLAGEEGG